MKFDVLFQDIKLFIIFSLLTGYVVDVEVHTPNGRVDIVLLTDIRLYIIELKLNRDAQTALQQINLKNYAQRFALCALRETYSKSRCQL